MHIPPTAVRYGTAACWLHWTMVVVIAVQVAGGLLLEQLPRDAALRGLAFDAHETMGIVAIALVVIRIAWNRWHPTPAPGSGSWQRALATGTHAALYVLMVAVPLVGYAMVDAKGYDVAFFGWSAPDFLPRDAGLAKSLNAWHGWLASALGALIVLHVGAALWHHFALRDGTLERMLPARR